MLFANREEAAKLLLPKLEKWRHTDAIVLAIPRGGVPLGYILSQHFHWPMDLIMVKKIGMPGQAELAIGAVSPEGEVIDPRYSVNREYLSEEIQRIRLQLDMRYQALSGRKRNMSLMNKTVVLVDDGIATGNTMIAAIQLARKKGAQVVVIATPVASDDAYQAMKQLADAIICLTHPSSFMAVGQYYTDFGQVEDEEVLRYMHLVNP
jgi:putative phosphoribosyl transferase